LSRRAEVVPGNVISFICGIAAFLCNGIHTVPWNDKSWVDRMEVWGKRAKRFTGVKMEYFTLFLMGMRTLVNGWMVRKMVKGVLGCLARVIWLVGHSNGADILCCVIGKLLKLEWSGRIEQVVLIAGAVEHDFNKNFLNEALRRGMVERVLVLASENDGVLSGPARKSRKIFGKWGYGIMGWLAAFPERHAEMNIDPQFLEEGRVIIICDNSQRHSTWLAEHFEGTADLISGGWKKVYRKQKSYFLEVEIEGGNWRRKKRGNGEK